jgi:hypothetical protein
MYHILYIEALFFQNEHNVYFDGRLLNCRINEKEEDEEVIEYEMGMER